MTYNATVRRYSDIITDPIDSTKAFVVKTDETECVDGWLLEGLNDNEIVIVSRFVDIIKKCTGADLRFTMTVNLKK